MPDTKGDPMPSKKNKDTSSSQFTPGSVLLQLHEEICGSINDMVVFIDRTGTIIDVNPSVEELLGYTQKEVIGRNVLKVGVLSARGIPHVAGLIKSAIQNGKETPLTNLELIRKDGTTVHVEASNHLVREDGKVIGAVGILRDITERRNAEAALRESEERFRLFFENEPEYCYMISPDGRILDVNKAALATLGFQKSELVGKPVQTIYAPESLPRMKQLFGKWKRTGKLRDEEMTIITKKGRKRTIILSADVVRNKDGDVLHSISVQRDITERKKAEQELEHNRDHLQQLVDERVADLQAKTIELEREVAERKRAEALSLIQRDLGRSLSAVSNIQDAAVLCLDAAMRASKMDAGGRYLIDSKTGGRDLVYSTGLGRAFVSSAKHYGSDTPQTGLIKEGRPVHTSYGELDLSVGDIRKREGLKAISILPILHEGDVIACMNMASHSNKTIPLSARTALESIATQMGDVIARLEAEQELLRERDRAQLYLDIAGVIIVALDQDGKVNLINRKGCEILGYQREEIVGKNWFVTVIPDRMREVTSTVFQRLVDGKIDGIESYENPIVTKKGDERIIRWYNTLLRDKDGVIIGTLSSGEDITERKAEDERMKRQLMRYTLEEGRLYLVQEEAPLLCIEAFSDALRAGYRGIAVSRTPEAEFRETVPGEYTFHWLAERSGEHGMVPRGENIEHMVEILPQHSIVLIDRLDYLVLKNGFDETLTLLERLRELTYLGGHITITSLDPSTTGQRELRFLEKEGLEISTRLRSTLPEDLLELVRFVYKQNRLGLKPSNTELGNELGISQPTVRKRVNQLVRAGHLVQRDKGRNKVVELSERGWQLLEGSSS